MRNSLHKLNTIIDTCLAMKKDINEKNQIILEFQKPHMTAPL